jgi:hypothetical protein
VDKKQKKWRDEKMGSQYVLDPKVAAILGHELPASLRGVGYWYDVIASVSLGTSTAKTKLGGTQVYGTGADYLLPTAAKCIVGVRPKLVNTTPTANQAVLATLKVESGDLGLKDFEVFANPIDSGLGTNEMQAQDAAPWYPLMMPCNGGEKVQFYGTAQIANTVAPLMSVDVFLSNVYPEGYNPGSGWVSGYGPVQAKIAGINYGGGPTATGTAASSVATDGGVTIAGPKKRLIGMFGVVVDTTPAASKPISGWFSVNASEISINPQRWAAEPITGLLGTTTTGALAHISGAYPCNLALNAPSTPKAQFNLDQAITTAGNFEVGYMYIDQP